MWVKLKTNWFVDGHRIRRGEPPGTPVLIDDKYRDKLPSSAVVVDEPEKAPEPPVEETPGDVAQAAFKAAAPPDFTIPSMDHPTTLSEMAKAEALDPAREAENAKAKAPKKGKK
jgi:hypothetical protein